MEFLAWRLSLQHLSVASGCVSLTEPALHPFSPLLLLLLLLLSRFSRVQLCVTPWTAAYQASSSMGFSRQQYFSPLVAPKCLLQTQERPSRNVNSMSSMGKQRHQEAKRFGPRSQAIFPGRSNDKEPPATQETWV